MALINCDFFSHALGLASSMTVILPEPPRYSEQDAANSQSKKYATLYLLHGASDDHTTWTRRTAIERYVAGKDLAVIMPAANLSFYSDMADGRKYGEFISEELPYIARLLFPLSADRSDNFIAGLSMGGYGAFKWALTHPDRYAAAASLSGVVDLSGLAARGAANERRSNFFSNVFGDLSSIVGSMNDPLHLADLTATQSGPKPKLYQWCGTDEGDLYQQNLNFRDHARSIGLDLTYVDGPGTHDWQYWDEQIEKVIAWLPMPQQT